VSENKLVNVSFKHPDGTKIPRDEAADVECKEAGKYAVKDKVKCKEQASTGANGRTGLSKFEVSSCKGNITVSGNSIPNLRCLDSLF
jgi:hypothetical protein